MTEALKRTAFARYRARHKAGAAHEPWWTPMLVCCSIGIGTALGAIVADGADWQASLGAASGAIGGAQPSWVIAWFKRRVEAS
jgi:hypothetical protein